MRNNSFAKPYLHTVYTRRLIRRLRRDTAERGRTVDSVLQQYLLTVRPAHEQFVEPAKRHCDLIVPEGANDVALDMVVSRLRFAIGH
jgi:uridine kinase